MRFDRLRRDLRFGLRTHAGTPVITLVIITTLALGIAASTLTFSLVNGLFLRPPPIREPERFVRVYHQANNSTQFLPVSYPEFDDLGEMRDVFDGGVLEEPLPLRVGTAAWSVRAFGERVSDGYFSVLGVRPALGRIFSPREDEAGEPVVIVSDGLWRRQFGANPDILNRDVRIDGRPFKVIGVAPAGFGGTILGFSSDLWIPFASSKDGRAEQRNRAHRGHFVMVRMTPEVDLLQARSAVDLLSARLDRAYPETNRAASRLQAIAEVTRRHDPDATFYDVGTLSARVDKSLAPTTGAAASLGLIGLMALGLTALGLFGSIAYSVGRRTYEIGVRRALGAPDASLVWTVGRETFGIVAAGVAGGIVAALAASQALSSLLYDVSVADPFVFLLAPLVLMIVCLASIGLPLRRAIRVNAATALRCE